MNPRTHSRGAAPDFTLPRPNPRPDRVTDALWWLVCMRLALEPLSANGGILAIKPGYHSYGSRLPGSGPNGAGKATTDHSIRRAPDREGPWWREYAAAHDWTFTRAHTGNYTEIDLYTSRLITAMRDPDDLRPDDVYAYTIGQADWDGDVEGYNEYKNQIETGDDSHLWHRHDSFRRNIIGSFPHMWRALTIDMGWTYAEWLQSTREDDEMTPEQEDALAAKIAKKVWGSDIVPNYAADSKTNPTVGAAYGVGRAGIAATVSYQIRDRVDQVLVLLGALSGRDFTDEAAIAAAVVSALGGATQSDAELAAALRAALGDRAAAVGQLLSAS